MKSLNQELQRTDLQEFVGGVEYSSEEKNACYFEDWVVADPCRSSEMCDLCVEEGDETSENPTEGAEDEKREELKPVP